MLETSITFFEHQMLFHSGPIAGVAAQGNWVASAGYDNRIILWDAQRKVSVAQGMHDHLVNNCAFSSDGRWLVSASSDYSARVWSLPEMRLHSVLAGHGDDVDMAAFSPNDKLIATCALDRLVRVFDRSGHCLHKFSGHTGNVLSLAWSKDGSQIISTSVDGTIRRWSIELGKEVSCTNLAVRTDSIEVDKHGAIFAGDDRGRIAYINDDMVEYFQAHQAGIKKIVLDESKQQLICLSYDGFMSLWDIKKLPFVEVARSRLPESIWARSAAVMGDGRIAVATFGSTYAVYDTQSQLWDLWNVQAGTAINAVYEFHGHVYTIGDSGELSEDGDPISNMGSLCNFLIGSGNRLFTGGQLGKLFDAYTGEILYEHHSPINCGVSYDLENHSVLAIGTYTGEIVFLKIKNSETEVIKVVTVYENAIKGLSVANDQIFSVCANTDIAWHSLKDFSQIRMIKKSHDKIVNDCVTIDDHHFATISRDRNLKIWNGKGHETYLSPHPNSVKCIAIDDGRSKILTGSYGGTVALFDLSLKKWINFERPTTAGISDVSWDSQQGLFLAASYDGNVYPISGD